MPRKIRVGRIANSLFLKEARALPFRERMRTRREMTRGSEKLLESAIDLRKDLDTLKEQVVNAAQKRTPLEGGTAKAKSEAASLQKRRHDIGNAISRLEQFGKNYFTGFEPTRIGAHESKNPAEKAIHEAWKLGYYFDDYIRVVNTHIKLIERRIEK